MSQAFDAADALARGLAQHVQRWASARGAAPDAARAAACAAHGKRRTNDAWKTNFFQYFVGFFHRMRQTCARTS